MRKDVQLGLAIGGVFLAVLIVWGLVISGSRKTVPRTARLETTGQTAAPTPDRSTDVPPAVTHTEERTAEISRPAVTPPVDHTPADHTASDAVATGTGSDPTATDPAKASADKHETNWNAIILAQRPEDVPAPLRTATPPLSPLAAVGDAGGTPAATPAARAPEPNVLAEIPTGAGDASPAPTTGPSEVVVAPTSGGPGRSLKTHTIQRGESFYTISKAVYGDGRFFNQIAKANPTVNPTRLRPGMVINLPDAAQIKAEPSAPHAAPASPAAAAAPAAAAPAVDPKSEYRVVSGDSLYKISVHLYGSGEEVEHIYDLNKAAIGPDKSKLKLGMVLKLPAAPTASAAH